MEKPATMRSGEGMAFIKPKGKEKSCRQPTVAAPSTAASAPRSQGSFLRIRLGDREAHGVFATDFCDDASTFAANTFSAPFVRTIPAAVSNTTSITHPNPMSMQKKLYMTRVIRVVTLLLATLAAPTAATAQDNALISSGSSSSSSIAFSPTVELLRAPSSTRLDIEGLRLPE
ncbi:MAG: hypothetical protein AB8H80_18140 [Planctomycetota bacterium]